MDKVNNLGSLGAYDAGDVTYQAHHLSKCVRGIGKIIDCSNFFYLEFQP